METGHCFFVFFVLGRQTINKTTKQPNNQTTKQPNNQNLHLPCRSDDEGMGVFMLLEVVGLGLTDVAEVANAERYFFPQWEVDGQFVTECGDGDVGEDYVVIIFSSVEEFVI